MMSRYYRLYRLSRVLCCFLNLEDNSGDINSEYSDVRYTVYIWWFPYLDYSLYVLISRISNLGLYNWFFHIYFSWYLITCSCMPVLTIQFLIHGFWLEFIDTRVLIYARQLALILPLVVEFSLPWTCMFIS